MVELNSLKKVDAIIAAVPHDALLKTDVQEWCKLAVDGMPFIDVKSAFDRESLKKYGFKVWRL